MPRLPIPSDTEAFAEETRAAVRHILQTRHSMPPPSSYLTYAGQAGALLSDLVDHLRYHTSLTAAETELAICTSARASNADYIWNGHVRLGLQAGVREEALQAVDTHGPLDGLTADEALIIRFGRELLESPKVSDATFNAVRARYGE
jgi:4-carboxymuconolactone decarboxylase